jgi:hypothetical protein
VIRRKLTLKRIDPWTVLKFGFVVNIALLIVSLLVFWVVWSAVERLGLVEQFCGSVGTIVLDLRECSLNFGNIFRTYLFLGMLGVIISTGVMVLASFLYNLIADLTGGLTFTFLDDSGDAVMTTSRKADAVIARTGAGVAGSTARATTGSAGSRDPDATRQAGAPVPGPSGSGASEHSPAGAGPGDERPASPPPAPSSSSAPTSATPRTPSPSVRPTPSTSTGATPSTSPTASPGNSPSPSPSTPQQDRPPSSPSAPPSEPSRPTPGSLWGDPTPRSD